MLLASDGLFDNLYDKDIEELFNQAFTEKEGDLENILMKLMFDCHAKSLD